MGFFSKIGAGLKKTRDNLRNSMNAMLRSFTKIDEELFEELEEILILSDTGAATASRLCAKLREKVKERGETDPLKIRELLAETAADMLRGGQELQPRYQALRNPGHRGQRRGQDHHHWQAGCPLPRGG